MKIPGRRLAPSHQQPGRLQAGQLQPLFPGLHPQRLKGRRPCQGGHGGERPFNGPRLQVSTGQGTGEGQHATATAVKAPVEGRHGLGLVGQQGLTSAQDRLAIGMAWAGHRQELLHRHLLRLVFALGELLKHHLALHREGIPLKARLQHQIEQQLKSFRGRLGGNQHVVVHIIEAGGGVAAAAEGLNPAVEFARRQGVASLEHHVLKEMGHAALAAGFEHAAGAAPEVETDQGGLGQIETHQFGSIGKHPAVRLLQPREQRAATTGCGWHALVSRSPFCWLRRRDDTGFPTPCRS